MNKAVSDSEKQVEYLSNHVMEPGPLSDRKLTGTWRDYVGVTKVGIIIGNLLPVIAAMMVAAVSTGLPLSVSTVIFTLLGTALIIASGTCLNNYIDRDIDQHMERTKHRVLAEGRLDPRQVLMMGMIFAVIGTAFLLLVNILATVAALIGLFWYVVVYTMWTKRVHHINTVIGSVAGAIPPVIGWTAITGHLDPGALVLFGILFLWQPPHFLALAMRRVDDYRQAGVPMLPVVRGFMETKRQIFIYIAVLVPASLFLFAVSDLGWAYVILALILGLVWLFVAARGFYVKDDMAWARSCFLYSLLYLTILSIGMMVLSAIQYI